MYAYNIATQQRNAIRRNENKMFTINEIEIDMIIENVFNENNNNDFRSIMFDVSTYNVNTRNDDDDIEFDDDFARMRASIA